jgi:hypothetical protein
MCCVCGGGDISDQTYDEPSIDDANGSVYDDNDEQIAWWFHNATDTEDGFLFDNDGELSGYW